MQQSITKQHKISLVKMFEFLALFLLKSFLKHDIAALQRHILILQLVVVFIARLGCCCHHIRVGCVVVCVLLLGGLILVRLRHQRFLDGIATLCHKLLLLFPCLLLPRINEWLHSQCRLFTFGELRHLDRCHACMIRQTQNAAQLQQHGGGTSTIVSHRHMQRSVAGFVDHVHVDMAVVDQRLANAVVVVGRRVMQRCVEIEQFLRACLALVG
mmetsp:Transcript_44798/g.74179  ORF Transcript_44798/g.74179 Transcript_44798/m.74179 type:complete len:213 (+) Transcript_44798:1469-2107(+)